jgi:RimJ/RimL family protein N-acetyltransferase
MKRRTKLMVTLKMIDSWVNYEVFNEDGDPIGMVAFNPETKEVCGLRIYPPYQNKGYGTEVIKELSPETLEVYSDNQAAIRCYEKAGLKIAGPATMRMVRG